MEPALEWVDRGTGGHGVFGQPDIPKSDIFLTMRQPTKVRPHAIALLLAVLVSTQLLAQSSSSTKALQSAAAKGNIAAMYALGSAAEAEGNIEAALTHFQRAAEAGYAGAQFKLGEFYKDGRGVSQDLTLAKHWYQRAAEQGFTEAVNRLRDLGGVPETSETTPSPTASSDPTAPASPPEPTKSNSQIVAPERAAPPPTSEQAPPVAASDAVSTSSSSSLESVAFFVPVLAGLFAGFVVWKVVRSAVLGWYRSREFFVAGRTAGEMITKEIGLRLQVEWIPIVAGFAVLTGVSVGGWKLFEILFGVTTLR